MIINFGTFEVKGGLNVSVTSDLPFDNAGRMQIDQGTLKVDGALPVFGGSVLQSSSGSLTIGHFHTPATLEVDYGLTINGGKLSTASNCIAGITGGNVLVTKGFIAIGEDGGLGAIGTLRCSGSVTMSGGSYNVNVDLASTTATQWWFGSTFTLTPGNTAKLFILTNRPLPAAVPKTPLGIILSSVVPGGVVNGDFAGGKLGLVYSAPSRYTAGLNPRDNGIYQLTP